MAEQNIGELVRKTENNERKARSYWRRGMVAAVGLTAVGAVLATGIKMFGSDGELAEQEMAVEVKSTTVTEVPLNINELHLSGYVTRTETEATWSAEGVDWFLLPNDMYAASLTQTTETQHDICLDDTYVEDEDPEDKMVGVTVEKAVTQTDLKKDDKIIDTKTDVEYVIKVPTTALHVCSSYNLDHGDIDATSFDTNFRTGRVISRGTVLDGVPGAGWLTGAGKSNKEGTTLFGNLVETGIAASLADNSCVDEVATKIPKFMPAINVGIEGSFLKGITVENSEANHANTRVVFTSGNETLQPEEVFRILGGTNHEEALKEALAENVIVEFDGHKGKGLVGELDVATTFEADCTLASDIEVYDAQGEKG